jgi:hypothetical protein
MCLIKSVKQAAYQFSLQNQGKVGIDFTVTTVNLYNQSFCSGDQTNEKLVSGPELCLKTCS